MDAFLDALQWPAMAVTLLAAWLVAARSAARRRWGFGVFVASNLLWSAWGLHTQAYALIVLQVTLGFSITDVPYLGLIHGANALAIVVAAVIAAFRGRAARSSADTTEASSKEATSDAVSA